MKFFKTVKGCVNFLQKNANQGNERELNGVVMFGNGLYMYADVATYAKISDTSKSNECFYHFKNESELIKIVSWLLNKDGYLCIE